jgi:hypothetical protein
MSWSSSLLSPPSTLSTPSFSTSPPPSVIISASDPLPEHLLQLFQSFSTDESSEQQQEFSTSFNSNINESILDLIGCFIQGNIHSKHVFHLLTHCKIFTTEIGKSMLTDIVWFWGTQVYNSLLPPLSLLFLRRL